MNSTPAKVKGICIDVNPENRDLERPLTWDIFKDGELIGHISKRVIDDPLHRPFLYFVKMPLDVELEIEDLNRILGFMKGFPDPVLEEVSQ